MSTITTVQDLTEALSRGDTALDISGRISGMPSLKLPAGTTLRGITDDAELHFGAKGLQLTANNTVAHLAVTTSPQELAIFNSDQVEDFGTLRLENITTVGQVYLTAVGANRAGRFETDGVHVREADVRGRTLRPHGFGVDALQGAFTAWNLQRDKDVVITAELLGVSAGTGDLTTVGGEGLSLVRGMQVTLQAIALSIQDGGVLESLEVGGEISTSGDNVPAVESLGEVRAFAASAIRASGAGADAVRATAGSLPVDGLALYARDGKKLAEQ